LEKGFLPAFPCFEKKNPGNNSPLLPKTGHFCFGLTVRMFFIDH